MFCLDEGRRPYLNQDDIPNVTALMSGQTVWWDSLEESKITTRWQMQRLQMYGQTGFLSSKSVQQVWLSRSVQTDDTDRNEFLFHFTELVKCSRINFHLMTMKVLNKAERLRPVTTLQSSQTHWCIDITVPQLLYAHACDTYCYIRR